MSQLDRRDIIKSAVVAVILVTGVLVVAFIVRAKLNATTLPETLPYADRMTHDGLLKEEAEYLSRLRNRRESEAFHKGRIMEITRRKTWGGDAENLGESGYAESQGYGRREREAFAMGIHFAQEEAKSGETRPHPPSPNK